MPNQHTITVPISQATERLDDPNAEDARPDLDPRYIHPGDPDLTDEQRRLLALRDNQSP